MFPTKNDLNESTRKKVIELLNTRLADSTDLFTQCKQAHWNVKGPGFIALHDLFDKVAADAAEYGDLIAERLVQLGGVAHGTLRQAASATTLNEFPANITTSKEHVDALSSAVSQFGKSVRAAIDTTAEAGDADTSDMFTEISRGLDKWLWFIEAHNHANQ